MKTPSQNHVLVELRHVSQIYGREEQRIVAVKDINFTLREGEFVALLGPTGCGKTTILRIITGLNAPAQGEILYRGQPLRGINPHATIVAQAFALFPWLTVLENVMVPLRALGVPSEKRQQQATQLIDKVGLDGFESAYPRELSGGMRQKVGFARAMAMEPELLCLDEPFSALDVLSAIGVVDRGRHANQSNTDGNPQHRRGRLHGRPDPDNGQVSGSYRSGSPCHTGTPSFSQVR